MSDQRKTRGSNRVRMQIEALEDSMSEGSESPSNSQPSSQTAAPKSYKDGAIDTQDLGDKPLGPQKGKNGPRSAKFICARCRKPRWLIDSEAGCAADLTRFSICSFCEIQTSTERITQELRASFRSQINALKESIAELRKPSEEVTGPPSNSTPQSNGRSTESAETVEAVRQELRKLSESLSARLEAHEASVNQKLERIKGKMEECEVLRLGAHPPRPKPPVEDLESQGTSELEDFLDQAHRRYSVSEVGRGSQRPEVCPPLGKVPGRNGLNPDSFAEVVRRPPPSRSQPNMAPSSSAAVNGADLERGQRERRRKKKRRRRKKKREHEPAGTSGAAPHHQPTNLLMGDSMVGRATSQWFANLGAMNKTRSFPGAGIKRVKEEVRKLDPDRNSTLIFSVGGNDFYLRGNRFCNCEKLLGDFDSLLREAKRKTNRILVVGLIPRRGATDEHYYTAIGVNARLATLCKSLSLRYADPWRRFFGRNELYQGDGIHFSGRGAREFAEFLSSRLFKPVRLKRKDPAATRRARRTVQTSSSVPVENARSPSREGLKSSEPTTLRENEEVIMVTPGQATSSDAPKRQRSPESEGTPSSQQRQQKKRRNSGDRQDEGDPPTPGNGSPSTTAMNP